MTKIHSTDTGFSNDPRRVPHVSKFFTNFPNSLSKKLTQKVAYAAQLISKPAVLMKIVMMESDTCVDSSCINTMNENCCGNFICEAGEEACSLDCGPFVLGTTYPSSFYVPTTFMFDVEAALQQSHSTQLMEGIRTNTKMQILGHKSLATIIRLLISK
eukprot:scaffold4865_cov83-Cyclotella_meneghiniana.AAC.10